MLESRRLVTVVAAAILAVIAGIVAAAGPYIVHVLASITGTVEPVVVKVKEVAIEVSARSGDIVTETYETTLNITGVGSLGLILSSFDIEKDSLVKLALFNLVLEKDGKVIWCGSVYKYDNTIVRVPGKFCNVTPVYVKKTHTVQLRITCRPASCTCTLPDRIYAGVYKVRGTATIVTDYNVKKSSRTATVKLKIVITRPVLQVVESR